jgi:hypothetical protein
MRNIGLSTLSRHGKRTFQASGPSFASPPCQVNLRFNPRAGRAGRDGMSGSLVSCGCLSWVGGSFLLLHTCRRFRNLTKNPNFFSPAPAEGGFGGGLFGVFLLSGRFPWSAARPLRGCMETKSAFPKSMPTLKALPQARVCRMGERARWGAVCMMDKHKATVRPLFRRTTLKMWKVFRVASFGRLR